MARRWSLGMPHPEHEPSLIRRRTGRHPVNGSQRYGTSMRCSCGIPWQSVSNDPPSSNRGRSAALAAYRFHLVALGEMCPECLGVLTHEVDDDEDVCTGCGRRQRRAEPEPDTESLPCL